MKKAKAPPLDVRPIAELIIENYESGKPHTHFETEHYKHALDLKRLIPKLNDKYVAHIEQIGIRKMITGVWTEENERRTGGELKAGKKYRFKGTVRGYTVNVNLRPDLMVASLVGAMQNFCKENGLQAVQIGKQRFVAEP